MSKKLTKEDFIKKASKIHNFKYDYSLVNYVNNRTKVKIICPIHGEFEQTPNNHFVYGCSKCGGTSKLTKEEFIKKANKIHNYKYDYSLVNYVNNRTKVKIVCPIHGTFEQIPNTHLNGSGCIYCRNDSYSKKYSLSKEDFINKAKLIHDNKYDYSLVEYKNTKTKIKIICPAHGVFEQEPKDHLKGKGCPKCRSSKGERRIREILKSKGIIFEEQKKFKDLKDKTCLSYDFYIPESNTLIEYNGIQHYKPLDCFGGRKKFLLQKHHDWLKREYAKKKGITLIVIPYNDLELFEF